MFKEVEGEEKCNIRFPKMYLKTPLVEEKIKIKDRIYLVNTRIEICIYKKEKDNYCSVISKTIVYNDGYEESVLLKYIDKVKNYDDVVDLTDNFMNEYTKSA